MAKKKTHFYVKDKEKGGYKFINHFGGNYDMYGATQMSDIFTTETVAGKIKKKEGAPKGKLRDFYKTNTNAHVAAIIYGEYLYMIAKDVIDGDIAVLKRKGSFPSIHVGYLSEKVSERLLATTPPEAINIDIRKLGYRFPKVVIDFGPTSPIMDRIMHVPKRLYTQMYDNIRNGKVYPKLISYIKKYK